MDKEKFLNKWTYYEISGAFRIRRGKLQIQGLKIRKELGIKFASYNAEIEFPIKITMPEEKTK